MRSLETRARRQRAPRTLLLLAVAVLGCKPAASGRCNATADCNPGAVCDVADHLCVRDTTTCTPACAAGQQCLGGNCQTSLASVSLLAPSAPLSPGKDVVQVHVTSDPSLKLGQLRVQATNASGGAVVASGGLATALVGDSQVVLSSFTAGLQGPGNLEAILSFTTAEGASAEVHSTSVPVQLDSLPPTISAINSTAAADAVGGWFPRTAGGTVVVTALVDDTKDGSGPDTASLTLGAPCSSACTIAGTAGAAVSGAATFSFAVPRAVQTPGKEAAISFNITAVDKSGNAAVKGGRLQIDDAPPTIDPTSLQILTSGVRGEDGQTWFPAGTAGKDVEVSIKASDGGAGLSLPDLVLTFAPGDIDAGQPATAIGFLPAAPDGTVHFKVPTTRTSKREGSLRFTIALKDRLGHAAQSDAGRPFAILVDDLPPVVSRAVADYAHASPDWTKVCGQLDQGGDVGAFHCGRGPQAAPDHALRDDVVPVTFTALDCGAGLSGARWLANSGGQPSAPADATDVTPTSTPRNGCANGTANPVHTFSFSLDLAVAAQSLEPPRPDGDSVVYLAQSALDRVGRTGSSPDAALPDGAALVSRVRWTAKLGGNPAGAPALLYPGPVASPAAVPRTLAVPLLQAGQAGAPHAVELFDATGKPLAPVVPSDGSGAAAVGDVAAGSLLSLWFAGTPFTASAANASGNCLPAATCSRLYLALPGSGASSTLACDPEGGVQGALALKLSGAASGGGNTVGDVAVSAITDHLAGDQVASFVLSLGNSPTCTQQGNFASGLPGFDQKLTGLSLGGDLAFLSSAKGFLSVGLSSGGKFASAEAPFVDASGVVVLPAAPALLGGSAPPTPFFGARDAAGGNKSLRRAAFLISGGACGGKPCWVPASWSEQPLALSHTPVHDGAAVFGVDDRGVLQAVVLSSGAPLGSAVAPAGFDGSASATSTQVSPPVLLGAASASPRPALLLQSDGVVRRVVAATGDALPLLEVRASPAGTRPVTPVLDVRGAGGVAYLIDGGCTTAPAACGPSWVWALQLDEPPLPASATAWPRPARDSCNSRSLEAACP